MTSDVTAVTLLASSTAGVIGRLICHPIDTIKSQIQASDRISGIRDAISSTWRRGGISGFYKGLAAVLVGMAPGNSVYLGTYEYSKVHLLEHSAFQNRPFVAYMCSGILAEVACCGIFLPVDVIKERLQVQDLKRSYKYKGSADAFATIMREEGVRGLYKGYVATIYSFGPFSAIYFALYEKMKEAIRKRKGLADSVELNFAENLFGSAVAGAAASFITNPLEIGKLRYQTQKTIMVDGVKAVAGGSEEVLYRNMPHATWTVYRTLGVRGLFRGAATRILFHTPSTAITMAIYEECKWLWGRFLKSD